MAQLLRPRSTKNGDFFCLYGNLAAKIAIYVGTLFNIKKWIREDRIYMVDMISHKVISQAQGEF